MDSEKSTYVKEKQVLADICSCFKHKLTSFNSVSQLLLQLKNLDLKMFRYLENKSEILRNISIFCI